MARDAVIQVRVSQDLKRGVDELFERLGIDTTAAVRLFLKQALLSESIPFMIKAYYPKDENTAKQAPPVQETDAVSFDAVPRANIAHSGFDASKLGASSVVSEESVTETVPDSAGPIINDYFDN